LIQFAKASDTAIAQHAYEDKQMPKSYFGFFPLDLYRLGSSDHHKLDVVRDRDVSRVEFYRYKGVDYPASTGKPGEVRWLRAGPQGGISLFDDIATAPITGKFWYKIPIGTKLPPGLAIADSVFRPDKATHYNIYPVSEMPLDNFKLLLRQVAELAEIKPMFSRSEKV
jgi:hypothetical protein